MAPPSLNFWDTTNTFHLSTDFGNHAFPLATTDNHATIKQNIHDILLNNTITLGSLLTPSNKTFKTLSKENILGMKTLIRNMLQVVDNDDAYNTPLQRYLDAAQNQEYTNLVYFRHYLHRSLITTFVGLTIYLETKDTQGAGCDGDND
jgi:hypothetical protein